MRIAILNGQTHYYISREDLASGRYSADAAQSGRLHIVDDSDLKAKAEAEASDIKAEAAKARAEREHQKQIDEINYRHELENLKAYAAGLEAGKKGQDK